MNTTNVESTKNIANGPVFLDIDFGTNLVLGIGEFSTERFERYGKQEIGSVRTSHNIIDDNMRGFRIVEEGKTKTVEEIPQNEMQRIIKVIQQRDNINVPVKQSEIDLIKKYTGYELAVKDKSLIIDDINER